MSKKPRQKKYNAKGKYIEQAQSDARKVTISVVQNMDDAEYITEGSKLATRITPQLINAINKVKHEWSFCLCAAGRFKNGKVWINYQEYSASRLCLAEELRPLILEEMTKFWEEQPPKSRICKWFVTRAISDHDFNAVEMVVPAFKANVFRGFINTYENEGDKVSSNYPPKSPRESSLWEWADWFHNNVSPKSKLKRIYREKQ